ncbi:hypothetical protein J6590_045751 [Homalodisca vitripennis]|nr:hypothetical protein J6590_045751 [Homalodisca vitripennis]
MPLHKTEALYTRHALYTRGDGIPRQTNICTFFGEVIDCGKINIGSSCRTTASNLKRTQCTTMAGDGGLPDITTVLQTSANNGPLQSEYLLSLIKHCRRDGSLESQCFYLVSRGNDRARLFSAYCTHMPYIPEQVIDCGKINIGSSCRTTARHLKQRDHHVGRLVEEKKAYVVNLCFCY